MHPDELFTVIRRRPFVPLRLHVFDGATYDICHSDSVLVTRRSVILALPGDAKAVPERALIVDTVHITRMEEIDGAASALA